MSQRNRVTPEGRALGEQMARLAAKALAKQKLRFPKMADMCASCAFRPGTIPNGCPQTQMDALKAVMEEVPFLCHQSPRDDHGQYTELCVGWLASYSELSLSGAPKIECPWSFSPPDVEPTASQGERDE